MLLWCLFGVSGIVPKATSLGPKPCLFCLFCFFVFGFCYCFCFFVLFFAFVFFVLYFLGRV